MLMRHTPFRHDAAASLIFRHAAAAAAIFRRLRRLPIAPRFADAAGAAMPIDAAMLPLR